MGARCRLSAFVQLARTITDLRVGILAGDRPRPSQTPDRTLNTQIRLITRRAFAPPRSLQSR